MRRLRGILADRSGTGLLPKSLQSSTQERPCQAAVVPAFWVCEEVRSRHLSEFSILIPGILLELLKPARSQIQSLGQPKALPIGSIVVPF